MSLNIDKKIVFSAFFILSLTIAIFFYILIDKVYVIQLSEKQIQEKLDYIFPVEKTYLLFIKVKLSDPKLILQEGSNRVLFRAITSTNISTGNISLSGTTKISGNLSYNSKEGSFYFKEPLIHELTIDKLPAQYTEKVNNAVNFITKKLLNSYPLYTLKKSDIKQSFAKLVLEDVVVKNGSLQITLGVRLRDILGSGTSYINFVKRKMNKFN